MKCEKINTRTIKSLAKVTSIRLSRCSVEKALKVWKDLEWKYPILLYSIIIDFNVQPMHNFEQSSKRMQCILTILMLIFGLIGQFITWGPFWKSTKEPLKGINFEIKSYKVCFSIVTFALMITVNKQMLKAPTWSPSLN